MSDQAETNESRSQVGDDTDETRAESSQADGQNESGDGAQNREYSGDSPDQDSPGGPNSRDDADLPDRYDSEAGANSSSAGDPEPGASAGQPDERDSDGQTGSNPPNPAAQPAGDDSGPPAGAEPTHGPQLEDDPLVKALLTGVAPPESGESAAAGSSVPDDTLDTGVSSRLRDVLDADTTVDRDGVHEDDTRLQSALDTDTTVDPDGVREDDTRRQSVRDDWESVRTVTETYRPSCGVAFRGDVFSGDDRARVMHPSDGVGYEFNKSDTDRELLRDRIGSLPADIQRALERGDANARVTITSSASREGSETHNQELSEARGQDMANAMRDLGVKSPIEVIALGESRAAAAGAPDIDNPADRVATIQVEVTKQVPQPDSTETQPPADTELPRFDVPRTHAEDVSESIDKKLSEIKPPLELKDLAKMVMLQYLPSASGYAGGKAEVAHNASVAGYATGVMYSAGGGTGRQMWNDLSRKEGTPNAWDQSISKAEKDAFNNGLVEGFKLGRDHLSPDQRESLWQELGPQLGDRGDRSGWGPDDWLAAGRAFRNSHLKESGE